MEKIILTLFSLVSFIQLGYTQIKTEFHFNKGQVELEDIELLSLVSWVDQIRPTSDDVFEVEAYSDPRGSEKLNMNICQKRADFVSNYLKSKGASSVALHVFGESKSTADENDLEACAKE